MFPAQALAEEMLARGWRVKLSTDDRGARYAGGFPAEVRIDTISSATFARGGILARLAVPFRIAAGIVAACLGAGRDRPAVIVGFGGYPSVPALAAAWILRLPRMIHEQNGVLGKVNRFFARRVDRIACGTWPTELPPGVSAVHIGNPVRQAIRARACAPYLPPENEAMDILVIGGSQGARILSDVVPAALAALPDSLRAALHVAHQAREEDRQRVAATYRKAGIPAEIAPFFADVPERLAGAQLVISRSGASSIADISAIGRPSILIPYAAAASDHQSANARSLSTAEAAIVIPEKLLDVATLSAHIRAILENPDAAAKMAANARNQGRPDAARHLADLVENLAGTLRHTGERE